MSLAAVCGTEIALKGWISQVLRHSLKGRRLCGASSKHLEVIKLFAEVAHITSFTNGGTVATPAFAKEKCILIE